MSNIKDVTIIIDRQTKAVSQKGFGLPLILSTDGLKPYKEYTDIAPLASDYPVGTKAYKIASRIFGQSPRPEKIAVYGIKYDPSTDLPDDVVQSLKGLVEKNGDFYYLYTDLEGKPETKAVSEWTDTQKRLYFVDTDDLALAAELESDRTVVLYHNDMALHAAAGWIGRCAPEEPGAITWKFKTINGVTEADIGTTELSKLHEDGGNSYVQKLGVLQSSEGLTSSGEYIDVIQAQDFVEARLSESVHRLLFTQKKVPFTDAGIAQIVSEVRGVFQQSTAKGIIALDENGEGMWKVTAPRRKNIPANDRAKRKLNGIGFEFTIAGAVHDVTIRGTIVV